MTWYAPLVRAAPKGDDGVLIFLGRTKPVDAGDRGNDQRIGPSEKRSRGRVTQLVDLLVDVGVFFDVGIRACDIRLGLVVVVVGNEVLDRVAREELFELGIELGRRVLLWASTRVGRLSAPPGSRL